MSMASSEIENKTHARESTIVPEVALVREAVAHISQLALLDILLNRVKELLFRDLLTKITPLATPTLLVKIFSLPLNPAINHEIMRQRTSCLALVQRGISTIMLRIVCCSLA